VKPAIDICRRHASRRSEINPWVISLRDEFHIPADDDDLPVYTLTPALFSEPAPPADVVLIDLYDRRGPAHA
jgi:hypothetical protein